MKSTSPIISTSSTTLFYGHLSAYNFWKSPPKRRNGTLIPFEGPALGCALGSIVFYNKIRHFRNMNLGISYQIHASHYLRNCRKPPSLYLTSNQLNILPLDNNNVAQSTSLRVLTIQEILDLQKKLGARFGELMELWRKK